MMDDALVSRWRSGEGTAKTAVRNSIRSIAERVLTQNTLLDALGPKAQARLRKGESRRELTALIAKEVMKRQANSAGQLRALALMTTGQHAIAALREGRPRTGEAHVPAQVIVSLALAPESTTSQVRDAANRHLESCPQCVKDLQVIEHAIRNHAAVVPDGERDQLARDAAKVQEPGGSQQTIEQLMREAIQKPEPWAATVDQRSAEEKRHRVERKKRAQSRGSSRSGRKAPAREPSSKGVVIPAVLVLGFGVFCALSRTSGDAEIGLVTGLEALADQSAPELVEVDDLPTDVDQAIAALEAGKCQSAAAYLRGTRMKHPDEARLYIYESASYVCAGKAKKALRTLGALDELLGESRPPPGYHWFRAQAQLLVNDAAGALSSLAATQSGDPGYRDRALRQEQKVRALIDSQ